MIEVMARGYNRIDLGWLDAIANQFPRRGRSTAEHKYFPANIDNVRRSKTSDVGVEVPHPMIVTFGVVDAFAPIAASNYCFLSDSTSVKAASNWICTLDWPPTHQESRQVWQRKNEGSIFTGATVLLLKKRDLRVSIMFRRSNYSNTMKAT